MKLNEKVTSNSSLKYYTLDIREFEHIEFLSCTYCQSGMISLSAKTNTGKELKAESKSA